MPDRRPWWSAIAAVAPGVLLLSLTVGRTPGMIWDSVEYCAAAMAFASRGTLVTPLATSFDGQFDAAGHVITSHAFVLWPPGYPLVVGSIARLSRLDVQAVAVLVSVLSLAVVLLAVRSIVARATDQTTGVATAALVGVLPATQASFRMALSEPVFLACCAVMVLALTRWLEDPGPGVGWSWIAAVAAGCAINVRFTGILLVAVHAMCAAWRILRQRTTAAHRLATVLSVLAGPAIGSAFLVYRLLMLGCLLCESRPASTQGIASNIRAMAVAGSQSLPAVYDAVPGPLDTIVSFSLLFLLLFYERARPRIRAHRTALVVALLFAVIYGLGLLILRTVVEFDSLDTRLVAPAALPIVAAALAAAFWH